MSATLIERLTRRTLYTPEEVEAIIAAVLNGTTDTRLIEQAVDQMLDWATDGRDPEATARRIEGAFLRLMKKDRRQDREILSRWRMYLEEKQSQEARS